MLQSNKTTSNPTTINILQYCFVYYINNNKSHSQLSNIIKQDTSEKVISYIHNNLNYTHARVLFIFAARNNCELNYTHG